MNLSLEAFGKDSFKVRNEAGEQVGVAYGYRWGGQWDVRAIQDGKDIKLGDAYDITRIIELIAFWFDHQPTGTTEG